MRSLHIIYNYKYISSLTLSPEGDKIAYIVSSVNEEDNDYDSNLFMMRRDAGGKNWQEVQLVTDGKAGEFIFEDNDTILFSAKRGRDKKKARRSRSRSFSAFPSPGAKPGRPMNSRFPFRISGSSRTEIIC